MTRNKSSLNWQYFTIDHSQIDTSFYSLHNMSILQLLVADNQITHVSKKHVRQIVRLTTNWGYPFQN